MLIIAIVIGLITLASAIAVLIVFGEFFLSWLSTIPDMPEFVDSDNFLAWLVFVILFIVVSYGARRFYLLFVNTVLRLTVMAEEWFHNRADEPQRTFAGVSGGFIVASLLLFSFTVIGLITGVNYLYDFASNYNPQLTEIYDPEETNGFIKFVHYVFFVGLLVPSRKTKLFNKAD